MMIGTRYGEIRQGGARQGWARRGWAGQGGAGRGRARRGNAGQGRAWLGAAGQGKRFSFYEEAAMNIESNTTELATITVTAIEGLSDFEHNLAEFRARFDGVVYDMTDPEQVRQARSDRLEIGRIISALDKRHRALKEPLLDATRAVDGRRKEIKDEMIAIQTRIKAQIKEYEAIAQRRKDAFESRLRSIRDLALSPLEFDSPSADIRSRIKATENVAIGDDWEEYRADAALARTETLDSLNAALPVAEKREQEAEELERMRLEIKEKARKEREERIAREASEKAKRAAEAAAREAAEAKERKIAAEREHAERKVQEALEHARAAEREAQVAAQRERERIEAERRAIAEEEARQRAAEAERKARLEHRQRIHTEAKRSLIAAGINDAVADQIIELVRDGAVAHVKIDY